MVRLTGSSHEEEVHANIRTAYEEAKKMEEEEMEEREKIRYFRLAFIFLGGFASALILAVYNC